MLTTDEVLEKVEEDPAFRTKFINDPVATLKETKPDALRTDVWVYRGVILTLGLVAAGGLALVTVLELNGSGTPAIFTAAISAAIGAMAGLLSPSPSQAATKT